MSALNLKPRSGGVTPSAWDGVRLIELLPLEYREQAERLIKQSPDMVRVLERCKTGEIDAWTALELMGIRYDGGPCYRQTILREGRMNPNDITVHGRFSALFPVKPDVLARIADSMRANGFDPAEPIVLGDWGVGPILTDGHMRREAAIQAGLDDIPVVTHLFASEDEALEYAIRRQRDRRNLTDAEIAACLEAVDTKKRQGERTDLASSEAKLSAGKSSEQTAELLGISRAKVERARTVLDHATPEVKEALKAGKMSINRAYQETQERRRVARITPPPQFDPETRKRLDLPSVSGKIKLPLYEIQPNGKKSKFNETPDKGIDWASWSWNPVTGCKHGCSYCYAQVIATNPRTRDGFPYRFEPTLRRDRLDAPVNTKIPQDRANEPGIRNVFVVSMGDLFGAWVPDEWINLVMDACRKSQEWNYIFLTKNPARLPAVEFPSSSWVGVTVDLQARAELAIEALSQVKAAVRFISCEPLVEPVRFPTLELVDWIIIGAFGKMTGTKVMQPQWGWVRSVEDQARDAGCKLYFKESLKAAFPQELPLAEKR